MYEVDIQNTQTRVARELTAGRILRVVHSCVYACMRVYVCVYEKVGEIHVRTYAKYVDRGGWTVSKSIDVVPRRWQLSIYDELLTTAVRAVPVSEPVRF